MSDAVNETTLYELADQFIALANDLSQKEGDVGKVGTALRFAAARFNAFEASIKSGDLAAEKNNALDWFSNEYREMLSDNLDDHIANPPVLQDETPSERDDSVQIFKG